MLNILALTVRNNKAHSVSYYLQTLKLLLVVDLIVGKIPDNEVLLKELSLTPATKIMMMGSIESDVVGERQRYQCIAH